MTFAFEFVGHQTFRFSNYTYWGIVFLYTKFQKFFSIVQGFLQYHKNCQSCPFSPKCQSIAFDVPRSSRFDISTGNRAHQVLPSRVLQSFGPFGKIRIKNISTEGYLYRKWHEMGDILWFRFAKVVFKKKIIMIFEISMKK